ncbi:MAG: methionine--tRNA ligase [Candidatus Pacebacteria bacterium]|nr:methionine--tRNA ligase [Candidatus Paceibacterota bacterium]MCD8508008.1 methionine--tRNA ligase [Candidatus Paceibacterota bacterium]MCD8528240.1 methionine--tRNA ligase [Candidatus Paceibacterota bacterium]MCD8564054.1 methionine--tRNA ligase [Candidatus Paceibacterota bacterium]
MQKPFYITTTLPYVNASPHVGFAMEIIRADVLARYKKSQGYTVFFSTGTDEHGQKIYQNAVDQGIDTQAYVDHYAEQFKGLRQALAISPDVHFIRTTDAHHIAAAQAFWKRCADNGYIYKKSYEGLYCVGCEMFLTDKDLVHGECPHHPGRPLTELKEENYFFKFSALQEKLLALYEARPDFVIPDFRFNEIKQFVADGLNDFSISRTAERMPWGIPVPGDDTQVMYVWFDALVNYISTLGWPDDQETFTQFWVEGTPTQIAGKDNLRQQSAMWQAMLIAADLPTTHQILINGFINSGGHKMSKSLGNVIDPYDLVREYGTEALRYYLVRHVHQYEDTDVTIDRFHEAYTAHLANGIGNLASRLLALSEKYCQPNTSAPAPHDAWHREMDAYRFDRAYDYVWSCIQALDKRIADEQPFKLVKEDPQAGALCITGMVTELLNITSMLEPLMPHTAERIYAAIAANTKPEIPLFARIERAA